MKILTPFLRVAVLALLANLAWFATSLSGAAATAAVALVLAVGFAAAFRDAGLYLAAAAVCAAVIVIAGLAAGRPAVVIAHGFSAGLFAFLSVAAPTLAASLILLLVAEVKNVSFHEARYGHPEPRLGFWTSVGSAAYGVPVGVACGLVAGFAVGGWGGVVLALVAGPAAGALAAQAGFGAAIWQVGELTGPVQPTNREEFLGKIRQVPGQLLTITITTVVLAGGEVREFATTQAIESVVMLLAAGGLAVLLPTVMSALPFRNPDTYGGTVKMLVTGLGALLGIGLGWLAGVILLPGIARPSATNLTWVVIVAAAVAVIAIGLGRLGPAVGVTIGAALGILQGRGAACTVLCGWSAPYRTLAFAGIGLVAGAIVFTVVDIVAGTHGNEEGAFRPAAAVLVIGGMLAAVALGAVHGIGAM